MNLSDHHHDEAVHQPAADPPIPPNPSRADGRYWYSGCDPDQPTVNVVTGICRGCGAEACPECGREDCPDHRSVEHYKDTLDERALTEARLVKCWMCGRPKPLRVKCPHCER